ncbi:MAG: type II secretion system protein [Sutterella sp.]|nr:type II secretion system protein [Sutterella sp.]
MKKQAGFTLIEIVMVLVLLGILAAVAVPKYFDLQAQAEERATDAIAAEYQAQLNGKFAQEILAGTACATARQNAIDAANNITFTSTTASIPTGITNTVSGGQQDLVIKLNGKDKTARKIAIPYCGSEGATTTPGTP